jgi:hypothetical protein
MRKRRTFSNILANNPRHIVKLDYLIKELKLTWLSNNHSVCINGRHEVRALNITWEQGHLHSEANKAATTEQSWN